MLNLLPTCSYEHPTLRASEWSEHLDEYARLIRASNSDSQYLRDVGLKPHVLSLIGYQEFARPLDVGCGDGWLRRALPDLPWTECDVADCRECGEASSFSHQDVTRLTFADQSFDLVVASLLLMWIHDLEKACRELFRVSAPGGRAVIALMHPAGYRVGEVLDTGDFLASRCYADEFVLRDLRIAERVGPFTYYHRPVSRYFNALVNAGWRVTHMREWSLNMDEYRRIFSSDSYGGPRRTDRVPMYLFFQCKRDV